MVCRYCDGHHWSDECRKFSTIEDRKQKIKGSCYTCLKPGHVSRDCKFEKACYHCKQKKGHHRSLCPKKIPSQQKEVSHLADEMCEIASSEENVPENSLLSSGDIVLLQTAQTTVSNTEVNETEVVRLLMDSGSQRTYITENLAKRLNLKKKATEEITLVTFGTDKPKTLRKQKVSLKIRLKDGVCMLIDANVVPKITGSILRTLLHMDVCENVKYLCNNLQLADTLPSSLESSTIEILIGNDYYLDIILPKKIEIQQGLYLLGSKLGWILTGRSQLSDEERENKMTMTVNNDENTFTNFVTSLKMENGRSQCNTPAKIGVVLLKDNLPHKDWKIGRICQLVVGRDGKIRSGKVMLPNKKNLNRALNMLYPIECNELNEGLTNSDMERGTELINNNTSTTRERTQRQAARTAMKKIQEQLES
ncbi:Hypothetical predicted protein [Mytilus galloprovincialis]|uniref:CCHC-type domain-containing protein n=1 Tax=Mytilus galloprovincialis TaxID=29158 RepID=A0A8B6DL01_MYTGA|nr:Hypothetical predicted protein [Mytilus galloprovincialis]